MASITDIDVQRGPFLNLRMKAISAWSPLVELLLFLLALGFAGDFWELVKLARYRNRVLNSPATLRAFIHHIDPVWLMNKGGSVSPEFGSPAEDIVHRLRTRTNGVLILTNCFVLLELILGTLSYTLNPYFPILNLAAFIAMSMMQPNRRLRNVVLEDIQMVLLYLYQWDLEDPSGCQVSVAATSPRLTNALSVVRGLHSIRDFSAD